VARRGAAGWALGVVAVAAAFAVGRSCAPVETVFVERPAAPSREPREQRPAPRRETPRAADVVAEATAAADAVLAAEPAPGAADVDAFPAVDVEVVRANGTPEPGLRLRARGGRPASTTSRAPHVDCDDAARLRLPRAGRYDVATGRRSERCDDVDAPGDHVVRLTLPKFAVDVSADDARPRPGERPVDSTSTSDAVERRRLPGSRTTPVWSLRRASRRQPTDDVPSAGRAACPEVGTSDR
jgi:hypothetical protein